MSPNEPEIHLDETTVSATGPSVRVRALIAYNGAPFHGFAYQDAETPTVALALRQALAAVFDDEPEITCAGRTDAGVHAWGQVIHFEIPVDKFPRVEVSKLLTILNRRLAPAVVVRSVDVVPDDFHARFSARARKYRYTVLNTPLPDPFRSHVSWWLPSELDIDAMNEACTAIVGEHDFTTFCRRPDEVASLTRNVRSARWLLIDRETLRFDIEANAFCHQMVRSLTGTLVAIGQGRRNSQDMAKAIAAKDRQAAATIAPPEGLCLWEVVY